MKSKSRCPECGGSGVVVLLNSVSPCRTCAAAHDIPTEAVPNESEAVGAAHASAVQVTMIYDALGRVISQTWWYPSSNPRPGQQWDYGEGSSANGP